MARPTKAQIREIIKKHSKNLKVVERKPPARGRRAAVESAESADAAAVKKKWISEAALDAADELEKLDEEELESVTVKPDTDGLDQTGDANAKDVIVSGSSGKVIASQG